MANLQKQWTNSIVLYDIQYQRRTEPKTIPETAKNRFDKLEDLDLQWNTRDINIQSNAIHIKKKRFINTGNSKQKEKQFKSIKYELIADFTSTLINSEKNKEDEKRCASEGNSLPLISSCSL